MMCDEPMLYMPGDGTIEWQRSTLKCSLHRSVMFKNVPASGGPVRETYHRTEPQVPVT